MDYSVLLRARLQRAVCAAFCNPASVAWVRFRFAFLLLQQATTRSSDEKFCRPLRVRQANQDEPPNPEIVSSPESEGQGNREAMTTRVLNGRPFPLSKDRRRVPLPANRVAGCRVLRHKDSSPAKLLHRQIGSQKEQSMASSARNRYRDVSVTRPRRITFENVTVGALTMARRIADLRRRKRCGHGV